MRGRPFEKGHKPTKPKGAESKTTKAAKELFVDIMEGEVDNIKDALQSIRKKNKTRYLEVLVKFFPYFIPRKLDIFIPKEGVKINITKNVIGGNDNKS
jgi:hypothetical protein